VLWSRPAAVVFVLGAGACLREPLYGDEASDTTGGSSGSGAEVGDDLGASGPVLPSTDTGAESSSDADDGTVPPAACHPSYEPCLPVTDDLNCSDVRDLDAAPVQVIGPDDYGLDADGDGIGCET